MLIKCCLNSDQVLECEDVVAQDLRHGDPLRLIGDGFVVQVKVEDLLDLLQKVKKYPELVINYT